MLSVVPSLNAMHGTPNAVLTAFASPRDAAGPAKAPTFSQTFSTSKEATPQAMSKGEARPRSQRCERRGEDQPDRVHHSDADSTPQALSASSALSVPVANQTSPAAVASEARAPESDASVPNATLVDAIQPEIAAQGANESASASPADTGAVDEQTEGTPSAQPDARTAPQPSPQTAIDEFERGLRCQVGDAGASLTDQNALGASAEGCSGDSSKAANVAKVLVNSQPQAQATAADAPAPGDPVNDARQDERINSRLPESTIQASEIALSLPSATTLISATAEGNTTTSPKANSQNRESIVQRIQPTLPNSGDSGFANGVQAVSLPVASNNSDGAGGANSNGSSSQGGGHSTSQAEAATSSHSTDGSKSSNASDSPQAGTQQGSGATSGPQNALNGNATSTVGAVPAGMQSAHIAAHAGAQVNATGDSSAAAKSAANAAPAASQSSPFSSSAPPSLPRSLNDVNQAAQLYQRVGGAEMHISMDVDALGSIDLRAAVHQGSLSATIGVQWPEVQTLLINELPALQHALAEKNFQVNQISVLAASVGSGANPDARARDQQNHQSTAPAATPAFRDDPTPMLRARAHLSEAAALTGISARLSVIA